MQLSVSSFVLGCAAALFAAEVVVPFCFRQHRTTTGRAKAQQENAFVLSVGLKFRDIAAATSLQAEWAKAAAYCLEHEPFLYQYEMSRSDKDPLQFNIIERYR